MRIDEAGRNDKAAAVDLARICRRFEGIKLGDRLARNEQIAASRWCTGTIDQCSAFK
jgi:hypothetical protein